MQEFCYSEDEDEDIGSENLSRSLTNHANLYSKADK